MVFGIHRCSIEKMWHSFRWLACSITTKKTIYLYIQWSFLVGTADEWRHASITIWQIGLYGVIEVWRDHFTEFRMGCKARCSCVVRLYSVQAAEQLLEGPLLFFKATGILSLPLCPGVSVPWPKLGLLYWLKTMRNSLSDFFSKPGTRNN